jgi:RNA ligase (TIGR02306 family)
MSISKSKNFNPNYLAKIVKLKGLKKHSNADKLQTVIIDFQTVITDLNAKDGDIYVYFPVECQINFEFLSHTNSFREKDLNKDKEKTGFFEKQCRVRAVKLRGERSMGYIVPVDVVEKFTGKKISDQIGEEFDTIGDILMLKKYEVPVKKGTQKSQGKKPRISRLVEGQYRLHVDTEQLRKNVYNIKPEDDIMISYKYHGSSWIVGNVLVKKKLNIIEKILKIIRFNIVDKEYDMVFGSRKVVKNQYETQNTNDFYDGDLWKDIKDEIKDKIPKGYIIYGEVCGYTKTGQEIQKCYDYGCSMGQKKIFVYRITITNVDGYVIDLSSEQIREFCEKYGLNYVHVFYRGKAKNLYPELDVENHWHEDFIKNLERDYTEKDCFICKNKTPEEGIVLRKEGLFSFEAFKLKSWAFLENETRMLDEGVEDIESSN